MYGGLVEFAGVLRDQLSNHLKVAELLDRDVLQHVADAGILDMEGLHPILQCRGELASGAGSSRKVPKRASGLPTLTGWISSF